MSEQYEQLELPLEYAPYDHYTIKLCRGAVGDMEVLRTHTAADVDSATNLIDGLLDATATRDGVQWQYPEPNEQGLVYGLAPGGTVYEVSVVPPLNTPLS